MYIFNPINKRLCGITQMGRIEYYIFILFIFITSCTDVVLEDTTEPKDLFEPPVVVELNFKLGYPINPVTGEEELVTQLCVGRECHIIDSPWQTLRTYLYIDENS